MKIRTESGLSLTRFMIIVAVLLIVIACLLTTKMKQAEVSQTTSNTNYNVERLFEVDGLKVYRFQDGNRSVYFVDGRNSQTTWTEQQRYGKAAYPYPVQVTTVK